MTIANTFNNQVLTTTQKYDFIRKDCAKKGLMPRSFRQLIQVQISANTVTQDTPLGDNRNRRVAAFQAGTVGAAFTAVQQILILAAYTIFLIPAVLNAFALATQQGYSGAVPEYIVRYSEIFIDVGVTIFSIPLGLIKTINPKALSQCTDTLTQYYLHRADRREIFKQKQRAEDAAYKQSTQARQI